MPTLFETESALREVLDSIAYDDIVDEDLILKVIHDYVDEAQDKRDRVAMFLKRSENEAELYEREAAAMREKATRIRSAQKRLEGYVLQVMMYAKTNRLKGRTLSITAVENPPHVEAEIDQIPDRYVRVRVEKSADKAALARDLKAGVEVPGAKLVPGQYRLVVR